jgi:hypothetical protein
MTDDDLKDGECPGCGSLLSNREQKSSQYPGEDIPTSLLQCTFCQGYKCCMCDMGDDVHCLLCDNEGSDPD